MNAACHATPDLVRARGNSESSSSKPVQRHRLQCLALAVLMSGASAPAMPAGFGSMLGALAAIPGEYGRGRDLDDALRRLVGQMNRNMPQQIDKDFRLDKVTAETGSELVYHYTLVGHKAADLPPDVFNTQLAPAVRKQLCQDARMGKLLDSGARIAYLYRGSDGQEIGKLSFAQRDCNEKG